MVADKRILDSGIVAGAVVEKGLSVAVLAMDVEVGANMVSDIGVVRNYKMVQIRNHS